MMVKQSGTWLVVGMLLVPTTVLAKSKGITGYSGQSIRSCSNCHRRSTASSPRLTISGPQKLKTGATGSFAAEISTLFSLKAKTAGINVSASGGSLAPDYSDLSTMIRFRELIHRAPKAISLLPKRARFKFKWTAPSTAGSYTLYGAGLLANDDKKTSDDDTKTTTITVTVAGCFTNQDCDDKNLCTSEVCDQKTKSCKYTKISNCCTTDSQCGDNNPCTTDRCGLLLHRCTHQTIKSCCRADKECDDKKVCTKDTCDLTTNRCSNPAIVGCCTDGSHCTDGNKCTKDICDGKTHRCLFSPINGCCKSNADCVDNNPCTKDSCDTSRGLCSNTTIGGCCRSPADCNDNNPCTKDSCSKNRCVHTTYPKCCRADPDCNDSNPCTKDSCNTKTHLCNFTSIPGCKRPDAGPADRGLGRDVTTRDRGGRDRAAADGGKGNDGVFRWPDGPARRADRGTNGGVEQAVDSGCCGVARARGCGGWPMVALLAMIVLARVSRRRGGRSGW